MNIKTIELLDESQCVELEALLVERIYEYNAEVTGYADGRLIGGCIHDAGILVAGFSGHTWGGVCVITHLWLAKQYRRQGLGRTLLQSAEQEALRRHCVFMLLATHSFQAPAFYERQGYERLCTINDWPVAHANSVYRKLLRNDKP